MMNTSHPDYIGLTKVEAAAKAAYAGLVWREVKEDGRSFCRQSLDGLFKTMERQLDTVEFYRHSSHRVTGPK